MYDWANSVYPLVITSSVFPVFYENATQKTILVEGVEQQTDVINFLGFEVVNTALYSYAISFSYLLIAALSPLLSGVADYAGKKKTFMKFFTYMGALSCAGLYFFDLNWLFLGLLLVVLASIGFSGSQVFYNAFLPEVAPPKEHDRLSAKGFALGYIGSSILLIFNLSMIMFPEFFGIHNGDTAARISFLTVGVWWIAFSQITFYYLPDNVHKRKPKGNILFKGYREIRNVWHSLKGNRQLKRYLASFFVFSMGVQTVMLMAVMFGKKEIEGMPDEGLIISILIIQFIAVGGAYLFSYLSSKLGNFKALGLAISIWVVICACAFFVHTPTEFYLIAAAVGLVMGGIQSLARSTYSKILPDTVDTASYFSFYDVCEKVGIVIGTFSYGYIEQLTGSMRHSIAALMVFFFVGLVLLFFVPKKSGQELEGVD